MRTFLVLPALAIAACYAFDEGQQQSWTFSTQYEGPQVSERATAHLARNGYQVLRADDRLIEAEKQSASLGFDVLRVVVEGAGPEGTRVRVQALTEEGTGGTRKDARYVTGSALADGQALVDALMTRVVAPPS